MTAQTSITSGYVDVNGLHMYYEAHGEGTPLVLLHGGVVTIDLSFADLIPTLAESHQVIAVEFQAHGRTADIDRDITPAALAGDIVGLLDHLGIGRAHILGHSMGAAVTIELAVSHQDRVRSIVPISGSVRMAGMHPDIFDPSRFATSDRLPTPADMASFREAYERLSPTPERFDEFLAKVSGSNADLRGWSDDQLAGITAPTLIVQGDRDFVTNEHGALMQQLIPGAYLAILPNTTHMRATRRPEYLLPMLADFLD
ncbi:MAG TPA: alpha/beta hydrolase [Pseudonocardiaceae bacterium]|nr:alpha/beta hydrolase [Pseudonocardiaceae bacterium]